MPSIVEPRHGAASLVLAAFAALILGLAQPPPGAASPAKTRAVVASAATDLGRILVDRRGRTAYLFEKDTMGTSTCTGSCASYWPPLLTTGKPLAGAGVRPALLGTTKRADGTLQVTYNHHPLYSFELDTKAGQTNGQKMHAFGADWYVVSRAGTKVERQSAAPGASPSSAGSGGGDAAGYGYARRLAGETAPRGTKVAIANSPLGRILVDAKGITLYDFPPDRGATSVCYGACAALWPPLLTHGKPIAGPGVRASLLGTTKRKDGNLEITYAGHPLYYFVSDRKPGETSGQGLNQFGGPWWVLTAAGKEIHHG